MSGKSATRRARTISLRAQYPMKEFSIAIVGGGGISKAHIAAGKATGGRVVGRAGVGPKEAALRAGSESASSKPFASFEEFLASSTAKDVDGVVVCTPPSIR